MGGNPESALNATLIRSGTTRVTVTASGAVNGTSRSDVIINPQGLDHFEFDTGVWNPADPQVTTIPFNIRIIARDAANNIFPLNGAVSLRVRIGAADESADYIITNNSTFVDGQLDALVQVTKRGFSAYLDRGRGRGGRPRRPSRSTPAPARRSSCPSRARPGSTA